MSSVAKVWTDPVGSYRFDPAVPLAHEVRRVGEECLGSALDQLDRLSSAAATDAVETAVHEIRKRCKEVRALARLVDAAVGRDAGRVDRLVRSAAVELASTRDAHATNATFARLRAAHPVEGGALDDVAAARREHSTTSSSALAPDDPRLVTARRQLRRARRVFRRWPPIDDLDAILPALERTHRLGRKRFRAAERRPSDDHIHEWRIALKRLWYQVRLVRAGSPVALEPLVAQLDALCDALGDDHDLAVLVERLAALRADPLPRDVPGFDAVDAAIALARAEQQRLRRAAFRAGAPVYAEPSSGFARRIGAYWETTRRRGPEGVVGGIPDVGSAYVDGSATAPGIGTEIERKYLAHLPPPPDGPHQSLRQGYLAIDGDVSARLRAVDDDTFSFTLKAGRGAVRIELEWQLGRDQFAALWPLAEPRSITKTRSCVDLGDGLVAEVDRFSGRLDGLVVVEVEFDSAATMERFTPPPWFGRDVTDDPRYANAALSTASAPPA